MVRLWDGATGAKVGELAGHTDTVYGLDFSPDGTRLASGAIDDTVRVWDVAARKQVHEIRGHQGDVGPVEFTPDGKSIVSASNDGTSRVWDAETGEQRFALGPPRGLVLGDSRYGATAAGRRRRAMTGWCGSGICGPASSRRR